MANFWAKLPPGAVGLAPMDGVTDLPTRLIQVEIAKPALVYTEFVSAEGYRAKPQNFKRKLALNGRERPVVAQIFGIDPGAFYQATRQISLLGFDGLDLNMGCPAKSVLGIGGGGNLIGNFKLVEALIKAASEGIADSGRKIPLSVKTRIAPSFKETKEWFDFLSKQPISALAVHGRTLKQGRSGPVAWEELGKGAMTFRKKGIAFLGNGGIVNASEGREMAEKYGLSGVLIGQAAIGNPWVFKDNYQPTKKEILETILKHARLIGNFYPKDHFASVAHKYFGWYPRGFEGSKKLKRELLQAKSLIEAKRIIDPWLYQTQNG